MQLYTMKAAAERLAVTRKMLYVLHERGQLDFVKVGGATRISEEELARYIRDNTKREQGEAGQTCQTKPEQEL